MDEVDEMTIGVRADRERFARDVAAMRATLEGGLGDAAERAGARIEGALSRAIRTGKLGFDDLRQVALSTLASIAQAAVLGGVKSVLGGGGGSGGGLVALASGLLGAPGRATGGPVSPGRAYVVGERGPELFVPTASGRVEPSGGGGAREVRVSIAISAAGGVTEPQALARSGRQVARAVRRALEAAD